MKHAVAGEGEGGAMLICKDPSSESEYEQRKRKKKRGRIAKR